LFFFSIEATDRQEEQVIGERVGETGRDGTGRERDAAAARDVRLMIRDHHGQ